MSSSSFDEVSIQKALIAAFRVIKDGELQKRLRDEDNYPSALEDLNLPECARSRLLDIITRIEDVAAEREASNREDERKLPRSREKEEREKQTRRVLMEAYDHIRWSFWVSLGMSVILFLLGMTFMGAAVVRSLSESTVSTATLTIAGLGIADFVLLFYTRPWEDIRRNLANNQQVRIIATSYLMGAAKLDDRDASKALQQLTERSVVLLEEFTEKDSSRPTKESTSGTS